MCCRAEYKLQPLVALLRVAHASARGRDARGHDELNFNGGCSRPFGARARTRTNPTATATTSTRTGGAQARTETRARRVVIRGDKAHALAPASALGFGAGRAALQPAAVVLHEQLGRRDA